jgi:hypothetical protein
LTLNPVILGDPGQQAVAEFLFLFCWAGSVTAPLMTLIIAREGWNASTERRAALPVH